MLTVAGMDGQANRTMAQMSTVRLAEYKKPIAMHVSLPSTSMRPTMRSYTQIRAKLHQTLQSRLTQGLAPKTLSKLKRSSQSPVTVSWLPLKRHGYKPNLKIEATVAQLQVRPRTELSLLGSLPLPRDNTPPRVEMEEDRPEGLLADLPEIAEFENKRSYSLKRDQVSLRPLKLLPALSYKRAVTLREALKDREWVTKARESIFRDLAQFINLSNGLEPIPKQTNEPYKYFIAKGNNSKLVSQLMKTRPGWVRIKTMAEANLVWSQRREMEYIRTIPVVERQEFAQIENVATAISCGIRYFPTEMKTGGLVNIKTLGYDSLTAAPSSMQLTPALPFYSQTFKIHNRLEANFNLTNKKALFLNMKRYYAALGEDYSAKMPLTFHIINGETDPEFLLFVDYFESRGLGEDKNVWIIKPGEDSNQGHDIVVCSQLDQIKAELRNSTHPRTGKKRTFILQKYIEKPFLYCKRKFDIRCYALVTSLNGVLQGYFYNEGYIRTSSKEFSLKNISDKLTHLTNDAVQKTAEDYGKFESGNKISFGDFQKYLDTHNSDLGVNFQEQTLGYIKELVLDTLKASFLRLDPNRRNGSFEVFGYDFMLDSSLRPVLIEVNTNPCLALVSPLLLRIIPTMLDGAMRIVLDSLYSDYNAKRRTWDGLPETKWELLFHSYKEGAALLVDLQAKGTLEDYLATDLAVRDIGDEEGEESEEEVGN